MGGISYLFLQLQLIVRGLSGYVANGVCEVGQASGRHCATQFKIYDHHFLMLLEQELSAEQAIFQEIQCAANGLNKSG